MIEEIVKSYKFYNTNIRAKYMLFSIAILITFCFVGIMNAFGLINNAIYMIYVFTLEIFLIASGGLKFWVRNNFGYGKFIRSIKNSYRRLKIMMIIRVLENSIYYFIYYAFLKLVFMIFKIQTFFSVYHIFYGIILGLFMLGIDQIFSYSIENYEKIDFINLIIICGITGIISISFMTYGIPATMTSINAIIGTIIFVVIYLIVIYAFVFSNIKKRWMEE